MANFPVKWFRAGMEGIPAVTDMLTLGYSTANDYLNCVPGEMIALYKAVLVDGFGSRAPSSITYDGGTGKVTVNFGTAHAYFLHSVVTMSGADQTEYNGDFRITDITSNSFSFVPDSAPGVTPATTGSAFESKYTPTGGWAIVDEDPVAHYLCLERTAPDASNLKLVIKNDINYIFSLYGSTDATNSRASSMSVEAVYNFVDFNNYDVAFQVLHPQVQAGVSNIYNGINSIGYKDRWAIYTDDYLFYTQWPTGYYFNPCFYFWGDIVSARPGDRGHCAAIGHNQTTNWGNTANWVGGSYFLYYPGVGYQGASNGGIVIATDYANGPFAKNLVAHVPGSVNGYVSKLLIYPNPANQGFYLSRERAFLTENTISSSLIASSAVLRGFLPGIVPMFQYLGSSIQDTVIFGAPGFENSPIELIFNHGYGYNDPYNFAIRLDQWRDDYTA
jgi:hypothetical protein